MVTRTIFAATAAVLLFASALSAQTPPADCLAPTDPENVRLALHITDPDGVPYAGVGRVAIIGKASVRDPDANRPAPLEYWYCSDELPQGRYTVEVRAAAFDCTALSVADSETGLLVRNVRLLEDPWQRRKPGLHGFLVALDRHEARSGELRVRRCGVS